MPLVAEDKEVAIYKIVLGKYSTNAYLILNKENRQSILIDAPDEPDKIMAFLTGTDPIYIFVTHAHMDHTGALMDIVRNIRVDYGTGHDYEPICVAANIEDMSKIPLACHMRLGDGEFVRLGKLKIYILETPGHTAGSVSFHINNFLFVGDTIFPGGPGHTSSPETFNQIVKSITEKIFTLPDSTRIFPGHGEGTTVGKAKEEYAVFQSHTHKQPLCGDVEWAKS